MFIQIIVIEDYTTTIAFEDYFKYYAMFEKRNAKKLCFSKEKKIHYKLMIFFKDFPEIRKMNHVEL